MGKFGKVMGKMGGGAAGAVGLIGGLALDYGRDTLDDPNSAGGKAMGVASGALTGAGTGALIGSVIPLLWLISSFFMRLTLKIELIQTTC